MVLQQTRSAPRITSRKAQSSRLDFNRILGISSTLALNVLALSMLLAPMTLPAPPVVAEPKSSITVVDIVPIQPVTLPPPIVDIVKPPPRPQPTTRETVAPEPVADVPVLAEQGIPYVEPVADAAVAANAAPSLEPAGPVVGMQLQYANAPAPAYPRAAIQRGLEGTVMLRILVGADGRPLEVGIERSSGHAVLDREAVRHVQRSWTFRPALRDGQPVQAIGIVPIDFRLGRG